MNSIGLYTYANEGILKVCLRCGATVPDLYQSMHDEWHWMVEHPDHAIGKPVGNV